MKKYLSYLAMYLLLFIINLFVTYIDDGAWEVWESLGLVALFFTILFVLDGLNLFLVKKKKIKVIIKQLLVKPFHYNCKALTKTYFVIR